MMILTKKFQVGSALSVFLIVLFLAVLIGIYLNKTYITNLYRQVTNQPEVKSVMATPYVSANGTKLYVQGQDYQFTGVNAYSLATLWGTNAGCGGQQSDLDSFFLALRPSSVVRIWAFQGSMATNVNTKQIDWTPLDRVVNAATNHGQKLILTLSGQAGTCDDGHWKDLAWYTGGYLKAFNDNGTSLTPLPFLDYAKLVVNRYKNSTTVAMWELVSEPESSNCPTGYSGDSCYGHQLCPDESAATQGLRSFFDTVGSQIKSIDPNHLIESGLLGDGQCGAVYQDYTFVHQSPGVDVASYHDYGRDDQPMPGDIWNGLQERLNQMSLIGKPLIVGEVGMLALDNSTSCINYLDRTAKFKAKMDAQFPAGVAGYLPWDFTDGISKICNFDIVTNDPLLSLLYTYPVSMPVTISVTPTISLTPTTAITSTPTPSASPTPLPDTHPPSAPTNLISSAVSPNQINLSWSPSLDNVSVVQYDIYRNNSYIASTSSTSFGDTNLTSSTTYSYFVKAKDAAGNLSAPSNITSSTTLANKPVSGIISGIVTEINGGVVAGAKLQLKLSGSSQTTYTNSLGFYTFTGLSTGTYNIDITAKMYGKQTVLANVVAGQTTTVNITLEK